MKRILIVGARSYIGESVQAYLNNYQEEYEIAVLDAKALQPEVGMFRGFDCVFNVAGIAHRKESKENESLYYEVNRDLSVNVAKMAKKAGVKQFILMSTMAVYGVEEGKINIYSKPNPVTLYGKSKLQADKEIWQMRDSDFKVAIVRPPMVYGNNCKGNYQRLRWLALHTPVFPKVDNKRSMLFIGNLNIFVKRIIDEQCQGLYFPQNKEYVNTSEMLRSIAKINGKKVILLPGFGWISYLPFGIIRKVFGTLVYEHADDIEKFNFNESMRLTENAEIR